MKNEDIQLIQRILADDETAFTELVEKYKKPVHALAWRKIGDFHIAEDITQDVFLIVYQRLHTLKDPNLFSGWLYVITTRLCATWLRKKRIQTQPLEDIETTMLQRDVYSHHIAEERANTTSQAQRDVVKKLLAKLKESERTVMTLHYLGEMTVEEISRFLGVSAGTIKSRLQRARNRLQREETMIREALDHFQISPNLTDNILQEVARLKPATPSTSKPLVPWAIAASSAVLIILMLGIGSQYLTFYQPPYSLDSQAEMKIELVDAPIVLNIDTNPEVSRQFGNTNSLSKSDSSGQKPDEVLLAAVEGENISVSKQGWIPSEPMFGTSVSNFHATPEGDLYTIIPASGKIYKLPANEEKWEAISDISTLDHSGFVNQIIAKWDNTMYYMQSSEIFASIDDGKTWDLLYTWDNFKYYFPIDLILTEQTFYIAFENGIFRSEDNGKTWKEISGKLPERIKSLVEVQNTLFAGTDDGLYRLYEDGWKRMELPELIKEVYSIATNQERVYVLAELSRANLNPDKVSRGHERGWGVFGTSNLGDRWLDITPINAWAVNGFIPEAKLIAAGETLILIERGMVRSNDGGITWLPPQSAATTPSMDSINSAVAVNSDTIYVGSNDGLYRSTDSGKSWDMVNITPNKDKLSMYDLIVGKGNEKGQNGLSTLYGRLGIETVKTADKGKSWMNVPVEIPMAKPHREQNPYINQMIRSDGVIYASVNYEENGRKVRLYRLSTDNSTFLRIQDMPNFDSDYFEPLEIALSRNPSVEHLQANFTGASEFFSQLVKEDFQIQDRLMSLGLRGAFAISGDTFYMEFNFKLFRWERGDKEWHDIKQEETVLSLDIAKQDLKLAASGNSVYVGKRDGHLLVSLDKGNNWIDLTPVLPFPVKVFKDIVFVGNTVYVATDAGVTTSKQGNNWGTVTDTDGTNLIMDHLAVDGSTLYGANKKTGFYRMENGKWKQIVSEIPDHITSLAVDDNTLYIGTANNGLFHFNLKK